MSESYLERVKRRSSDPNGYNPVRRPYHNANLSNREIANRIEYRNKKGLPTKLLRDEAKRRINNY